MKNLSIDDLVEQNSELRSLAPCGGATPHYQKKEQQLTETKEFPCLSP